MLDTLVRAPERQNLLVHGPSGSEPLRDIRRALDIRKLDILHKQFPVHVLGSCAYYEVIPPFPRELIGFVRSVADSIFDDVTLVIRSAEELPRKLQLALRPLMERSRVRFILVTYAMSRIIEPIRKRCVHVRIPLPKCLTLPGYAIEGTRALDLVRDWRGAAPSLQPVARLIANADMTSVLQVRRILYDHLSHLIPVDVIFKAIVTQCGGDNGDSSRSGRKQQLIALAAHYEHQSRRGKRPIVFLEAFVIACMQQK